MKSNARFIVFCLAGLATWFVQAMTFVDLVHPDEVLLDERPSDRVAVAADGTVMLVGGEASFIRLKWKTAFPKQTKVYASQWERTYGRNAWFGINDRKKPYGGALNWYLLVSDGMRTGGCATTSSGGCRWTGWRPSSGKWVRGPGCGIVRSTTGRPCQNSGSSRAVRWKSVDAQSYVILTNLVENGPSFCYTIRRYE